MFKTKVLVAASVLCVAAVGSVAIATPQPVPTLQQCASLLPKGKTYTYSLTGKIDTAGAQPVVSGNFSASDDTTADRSKEGAAFGKCIASMVK
jgi:hypothetical protein